MIWVSSSKTFFSNSEQFLQTKQNVAAVYNMKFNAFF